MSRGVTARSSVTLHKHPVQARGGNAPPAAACATCRSLIDLGQSALPTGSSRPASSPPSPSLSLVRPFIPVSFPLSNSLVICSCIGLYASKGTELIFTGKESQTVLFEGSNIFVSLHNVFFLIYKPLASPWLRINHNNPVTVIS